MKKINKTLTITIAIIILIIILNSISSREDSKRIQRDLKISNIKSAYTLCQYEAESIYDQDWQRQCKLNGLEENCGLSTNQSERIGEILKDRKDRCFDEYKLDIGTIAK